MGGGGGGGSQIGFPVFQVLIDGCLLNHRHLKFYLA